MGNLIGRFKIVSVLCIMISSFLIGTSLAESIFDIGYITSGGECFLNLIVALSILILSLTAMVYLCRYLLKKDWRCSKCGKSDFSIWIGEKYCQSCGALMEWRKKEKYLLECPSGHRIEKDYVFHREYYCPKCGQLMTSKGRE